jgi:hypothetical protein
MTSILRGIFYFSLATVAVGYYLLGNDWQLKASNDVFPTNLVGRWHLASLYCDGKPSLFNEFISDGSYSSELRLTGTKAQVVQSVGSNCEKNVQLDKLDRISGNLFEMTAGRVQCENSCKKVSQGQCDDTLGAVRIDFKTEHFLKLVLSKGSEFCDSAAQVATLVYEKL